MLSRARAPRGFGLLSALALVAGSLFFGGPRASASHLPSSGATYTTNSDFHEGSLINVVTLDDALRLSDQVEPFRFIWVAVSSKGTIVKIDTRTGAVLGEYLSSPDGMRRDPSRTTVDKDGSVWVSNRAEVGFAPAAGLRRAGASGSIVHVGLEENGGCRDRNGNGVVDTSRGYGDVKVWTNAGGANSLGGVSTAADECVIHYVRVNSTGTRHVSVTRDNDVWVSGTGERDFDLVDGETGTIIRAEISVGCGGYGGLIDANGVIWSARPLLRWDTSRPLTAGNYTCYPHDSYGLGIDPQGNVWDTQLFGNAVRKFSPDGTQAGLFSHGAFYAQGVVADRRGDIWVAHSLFDSSVGHLRNDGTFVGNVAVGSGPTGVAVDAAGKVWATNYNSGTATRINPDLNVADLHTRYLGGNPYNYSDMTGSVLIGAPDRGRWTITHDGRAAGVAWDVVTWTADVAGDGALTVAAAASNDRATFGPPIAVQNGVPFALSGRYLQATVSFQRATTGQSPVLKDLTIGRRTSTIVARPAVAEIVLPQPEGLANAGTRVYFPYLSAKLTDAQNGAPVAGKTVRFTAVDALDGTRTFLCSAVTGSEGAATCGGVKAEVGAVRGLGYEALFAGDAFYLTAGDTAPLAHVRGEIP